MPYFHRPGTMSIFKIQYFSFSLLNFGKKVIFLDTAFENFTTPKRLLSTYFHFFQENTQFLCNSVMFLFAAMRKKVDFCKKYASCFMLLPTLHTLSGYSNSINAQSKKSFQKVLTLQQNVLNAYIRNIVQLRSTTYHLQDCY